MEAGEVFAGLAVLACQGRIQHLLRFFLALLGTPAGFMHISRVQLELGCSLAAI